MLQAVIIVAVIYKLLNIDLNIIHTFTLLFLNEFMMLEPLSGLQDVQSNTKTGINQKEMTSGACSRDENLNRVG